MAHPPVICVTPTSTFLQNKTRLPATLFQECISSLPTKTPHVLVAIEWIAISLLVAGLLEASFVLEIIPLNLG
jgi:hypothetical protein